MKKHIALYGGSFDPPHLGHIAVINALLNVKGIDEIWIIPTGDRVDKKHNASANDRKLMVSLMLSNIFGDELPVRLDTVQLEEKIPGSTTMELIDYLKDKHPDCQFSFVIGSDLIDDIPKWKSAERLMRECSFLLVVRYGTKVPENLPGYITSIQNTQLFHATLSSTLIRQFTKEGKCIAGLVPPSVLRHIEKKNLYR